MIIETLASTLKKHKHMVYNVLAITTAKVPIVKFKHARTQLEGDISLYNTLVSDSLCDLFHVPYCLWSVNKKRMWNEDNNARFP